ncbi:hypothetical protein [Komagataeibacter rhaeticus]|uniref:hypothetical protein n=1 Tax=Komagataeibacter rhaeticus TaxID=215221 RepID=UPI00055591A5|nr:hypothetical protein [Komagataeibacter rhaeticus]
MMTLPQYPPQSLDKGFLVGQTVPEAIFFKNLAGLNQGKMGFGQDVFRPKNYFHVLQPPCQAKQEFQGTGESNRA